MIQERPIYKLYRETMNPNNFSVILCLRVQPEKTNVL